MAKRAATIEGIKKQISALDRKMGFLGARLDKTGAVSFGDTLGHKTAGSAQTGNGSAVAEEIKRQIENLDRKINRYITRNVKLTPNEAIELFGDLGDQIYGSRTYSQHGDDVVTVNIFETLKIKRPSYMDIGAHHPFKISNTALLHARGSRGINIDANENLMELFYAQRPDDINLNVGVAGTPGLLTFYMFDDSSGMNTFDPARARQIESGGRFQLQREIEVPVTTIPRILQDHWPVGFPDFLSIDVEGLDLEILQSIDYAGPTPKLICVEANSSARGKALAAFIESVGYQLYFRASVNMFFLRSDLLPELRP